MRLSRALLALAALAVPFTAHADSFQFSFGSDSSAFSGSGVLTTGDPVAFGQYVVTGITGTARVAPAGPLLTIAQLLPPGSFPTPTNGGSFPANDNALFVLNNVGRFDGKGLSFLVSGGAQINLFANTGSNPTAFLLATNGVGTYENASLSITPVAATPEPSSLALLSSGLFACALGLKRRFA